MSRPTPEQAIRRALANSRGTNNLNRENYLQDAIDAQLAALADHGYVIVHPDDIRIWWYTSEEAVDPYSLMVWIESHADAEQEQTP